MAFVDAGQDRLAPQIQDPCIVTNKGFNVIVRTNGNDLPILYSHRLLNGEVFVYRDDLGMGDDQIRSLLQLHPSCFHCTPLSFVQFVLKSGQPLIPDEFSLYCDVFFCKGALKKGMARSQCKRSIFGSLNASSPIVISSCPMVGCLR